MIVLNVWGGRVFEPLMHFIEQEKDKTDVFLFQEMYGTSTDRTEFLGVRINLLNELQKTLKGFYCYSSPSQDDAIGHDTFPDIPMTFGPAAFLKKDIALHKFGEVFVVGHRSCRTTDATTDGRNLQYFEIVKDERPYTIVNFHGLWNGQGKGDSPERLAQSHKVKEFMDGVKGPKILAGDFNVLPDTDSLKMLEGGMKNLIKEFGISSTRSEKFYPKPLKFADYVLVSPEVKVTNFQVPAIDVSDHLPMIVEFE